jgi:hypothetical protein
MSAELGIFGPDAQQRLDVTTKSIDGTSTTKATFTVLSRGEPQYEIKSDKTDHVALHKVAVLRRLG